MSETAPILIQLKQWRVKKWVIMTEFKAVTNDMQQSRVQFRQHVLASALALQCPLRLSTQLVELEPKLAEALGANHVVCPRAIKRVREQAHERTEPLEHRAVHACRRAVWFWKCVFVARDTEGGAPLEWLGMMTADLDSTIACVNADANSTQTSTLLRHLQLQPDIYISSVTARTNIDLFSDMLISLEMTFAFWNINPLPDKHCFVTPVDEHED